MTDESCYMYESLKLNSKKPNFTRTLSSALEVTQTLILGRLKGDYITCAKPESQINIDSYECQLNFVTMNPAVT